MTFTERLINTDISRLRNQLEEITPSRVEAALAKPQASFSDFLALISPAAEKYLEEMAQQARQISLRRFGRVILLYVPLYLTNECTNACLYCGFNVNRDLPRITLSLDEILSEAARLK
ncbi:MAG TPA: 2-iminoacetate synthase ThiH, partial [Bacteroidetes bacterium]|nr:2-iminoacetate synthase ThiH [Bacteroidota bacterium]